MLFPDIAVECHRFCHGCAGQDYGIHDPECSSSDDDPDFDEDDEYSDDNQS